MADFHFDHNISVRIAAPLRRFGHTAVTAGELRLPGATDDEHLLVAAERRSVLVSHNRKDFILLHGAWRRWSTAWGVVHPHAGILTVAQLNPTWVPRIAQEIAGSVTSNPPRANMLSTWRPVSGWTARA